MRIKITDIRNRLNISQKDLADRVGLSRPYMSQIEKGTRNLTAKKQEQIAAALGVDPVELVDFSAAGVDEEQEALVFLRSLRPDQRRKWLELGRVVFQSGSA